MKRLFALLMCLSLASLTGCSICSSEFDSHYPAYGGLFERDNAVDGRVGSTFSSNTPRNEFDPDTPRSPSHAEPIPMPRQTEDETT